jgi:hypothetical protein
MDHFDWHVQFAWWQVEHIKPVLEKILKIMFNLVPHLVYVILVFYFHKCKRKKNAFTQNIHLSQKDVKYGLWIFLHMYNS